MDVVDTTKELLEGEDSLRGSQKPHMVLSPGDERRIKGMMLTGWMGRPSQRLGQPGQEEGSARPGSIGERSRGAGDLQAPQGED